ncbi:putative cytochrome P450 oxidoreductase [Rosellinia necatrix]|uniref:Putative cytochrome P450 oxidoreductase n=1 Tax=Rosellinia necatrix TaxID=77044 RepID=A0A1S7UMU3_ROSNE|nr:putative cytochrome P450 oxidoreductase [Rosellinia necatrix]
MWHALQHAFTRLQEEYACARNGIGPLRLTKAQILGLFLRKSSLDIRNSWSDASLGARIALLVFLYSIVMLAADRASARLTTLTRRGFPSLRRPKGQRRWDFQAKMEDGARRFPSTPYIVRYAGFEQIVYPSSSFHEVKSLSVDQASLMEYYAHCYFEGWHFLGREIGALHATLSNDLARSLPARVHERQGIAKRAFGSLIGPCPEWKSITLYGTTQKLVAMMNSPMLVGPELGTDPRWVNGLDMFLYSLIFALFTLSHVPRLLRPVVKYVAFAPNWFFYWRMKRLAYPIVKQDLREYGEGRKPATETFRLGACLAARYKAEDRTADRLAQDFIVTMFESLGSTTCSLYFIISELALRPDLADELRDELKANLIDGQLPKSQLSELRKMDSFMRESMRTNVFSYLTVFRRLLKPVKLSIGPELPAGAIIGVDAYNMGKSQAKWGDPDTFDPERFLKMRQEPGHESLHQFTSLDSDMSTWGGGHQACPGRFFASNSIKISLTHLLLNYDIKLSQGSTKPSVGSLPNGSVWPDMRASILIRERRNHDI